MLWLSDLIVRLYCGCRLDSRMALFLLLLCSLMFLPVVFAQFDDFSLLYATASVMCVQLDTCLLPLHFSNMIYITTVSPVLLIQIEIFLLFPLFWLSEWLHAYCTSVLVVRLNIACCRLCCNVGHG